MKDYIIRKAKETDIDAILELEEMMADYHHQLDNYWNGWKDVDSKGRKEVLIKESQNSNVNLLVATDHNMKAIGYYKAEIITPAPIISHKKIGYIYNCFTSEKYRGKGIATDAMKILFDWFRSEGVKIAELTVDSNNELALKTWEKLGFKETRKKMKLEL